MVIVSSNNRVVALRLLRILRSHFRWGQSWLRHRSVWKGKVWWVIQNEIAFNVLNSFQIIYLTRFCVDSWFACIFDYRSGTVTGNSSLCSAGNSSPLPLILDLNLTSASMWRKLISLQSKYCDMTLENQYTVQITTSVMRLTDQPNPFNFVLDSLNFHPGFVFQGCK